MFSLTQFESSFSCWVAFKNVEDNNIASRVETIATTLNIIDFIIWEIVIPYFGKMSIIILLYLDNAGVPLSVTFRIK